MTVFLNGDFVPEEKALISVFDRGFLYGDGLFETVPVYHSRPFRWPQHLERLRRGADCLGLQLPFSTEDLTGAAGELIRQNRMSEAVLRLEVTRGPGMRGYSPRHCDRPTTVLSLHPLPSLWPPTRQCWRLVTSSLVVPAGQRLQACKTCNRLVHILARAEAEGAGADEALLLNTRGNVAEAAGANLFWIERGAVSTPPLEEGVLEGITRAIVMAICEELGQAARQQPITPASLCQADGVFLTLSTLGVVEVTGLDARPLGRSPLVRNLHEAYFDLVRRETGCAG